MCVVMTCGVTRMVTGGGIICGVTSMVTGGVTGGVTSRVI